MISDVVTREREVGALVKLSGFYELDKLEIVTFENESIIELDSLTVRVIPIWKWLLGV